MMIAHDIDYRATGNAPVCKKWEEADGLRNRLATRSSVLLIWSVVTHVL
jgi:hypothetical protein